ncbi:DUF4280 domain-containing protein [Clostridium gasigenes]|uniref:DUF4280 domain-containing protein n=1 Tax=Clostridium gasigenes TaxID=94869 RepID=UPI001C0A9EF7|nr:DUF4280 domain-containing protein [Clostridium gasigenes]MBU3133969.1 DUF4280 domain-containing protein [Clostridium gasigenes]
MASENEEQYGAIAGTAKTEVEKGVKDTVESASQMATMAKNVGGYLNRDIKKAGDWLNMTPQEHAAEKERKKQEAEEAQAAEDQKKDDEKKAAEVEAARMEELKKSYILHTAVIICSCAIHESYVVLPISHGELIHGNYQLNVGDSKPEINIRSFGICNSPKNPAVQDAAKKIMKDIKERPKSFMDKVMDLFSKEPSYEVSDDLVSKCVGKCIPQIFTEWIDGKEDVLVDGKPALLGKCTLECSYGGHITLYTSGQME